MATLPSPYEIRELFSVPGVFDASTCRRADHGIDILGTMATRGGPVSIGITVRPGELAQNSPVFTDRLALGWTPAGRKIPDGADFQGAVQSLLQELARRTSDAGWLSETATMQPHAVTSFSFTLLGRRRTIDDDMLMAAEGQADLDIRVQLHSNCLQRCLFCPTSSPEFSPDDQDGDLAFIRELADSVITPARAAGLFTTFSIDADDLSSHRHLRAIMELIHRSCGCPVYLVFPANRLSSKAVMKAILELPGLLGISTTILGSSAATHDFVAGRPGAFAETVRALRNMSACPLWLQGHFVLTQKACGEIGQTVATIAHFGIDVLIQNLIADCPRHNEILPAIMADLATIRSSLDQASDRILASSKSVNVTISDFPVCAIPPALRHLAHDQHPRESLFYYSLTDACRDCAHNERCAGIPAAYLDRFGTTGMRPEPPLK